MKTLLLLHGPNLNLLGKRDPNHYGEITLESLEQMVEKAAKINDFKIEKFQSNHEGALIDWLQENSPEADAVIINPGALSHYSYALHDALVDADLPTVEVHLSDLENREEWRKISVTAPACVSVISGKKEQGYIEAMKFLKKYLSTDEL